MLWHLDLCRWCQRSLCWAVCIDVLFSVPDSGQSCWWPELWVEWPELVPRSEQLAANSSFLSSHARSKTPLPPPPLYADKNINTDQNTNTFLSSYTTPDPTTFPHSPFFLISPFFQFFSKSSTHLFTTSVIIGQLLLPCATFQPSWSKK